MRFKFKTCDSTIDRPCLAYLRNAIADSFLEQRVVLRKSRPANPVVRGSSPARGLGPSRSQRLGSGLLLGYR